MWFQLINSIFILCVAIKFKRHVLDCRRNYNSALFTSIDVSLLRSDFCGKGYQRSVNGSICSTNTALPAEYSSVRQINLVNAMANLLHLTSEQWFHEIAEDMQFKYMCCLLGGPPLLAKLRNLGDKENIPFWLYCCTRLCLPFAVAGAKRKKCRGKGKKEDRNETPASEVNSPCNTTPWLPDQWPKSVRIVWGAAK